MCPALPRSLNKVSNVSFPGKANVDQGSGKRRHLSEGHVLRWKTFLYCPNQITNWSYKWSPFYSTVFLLVCTTLIIRSKGTSYYVTFVKWCKFYFSRIFKKLGVFDYTFYADCAITNELLYVGHNFCHARRNTVSFRISCPRCLVSSDEFRHRRPPSKRTRQSPLSSRFMTLKKLKPLCF